MRIFLALSFIAALIIPGNLQAMDLPPIFGANGGVGGPEEGKALPLIDPKALEKVLDEDEALTPPPVPDLIPAANATEDNGGEASSKNDDDEDDDFGFDKYRRNIDKADSDAADEADAEDEVLTVHEIPNDIIKGPDLPAEEYGKGPATNDKWLNRVTRTLQKRVLPKGEERERQVVRADLLVEQAQKALEKEDCQLAEELSLEALELDPGNKGAREIFKKAGMKKREIIMSNIRAEKLKQFDERILDVEKAAVPYVETKEVQKSMITSPYSQEIRMREETQDITQLRDELNKVLVDLDFRNADLREVIRYLSETSDINIVIDEGALLSLTSNQQSMFNMGTGMIPTVGGMGYGQTGIPGVGQQSMGIGMGMGAGVGMGVPGMGMQNGYGMNPMNNNMNTMNNMSPMAQAQMQAQMNGMAANQNMYGQQNMAMQQQQNFYNQNNAATYGQGVPMQQQMMNQQQQAQAQNYSPMSAASGYGGQAQSGYGADQQYGYNNSASSSLTGIDGDVPSYQAPQGQSVPSPKVTIYLRKVPLLTALDVVLRTKGLRYRIEKSFIWISNEQNLQMEDLVTRIYTLQHAVGDFVNFTAKGLELGDIASANNNSNPIAGLGNLLNNSGSNVANRMFNNSNTGMNNQTQNNRDVTRAEAAEDLIGTLKRMVPQPAGAKMTLYQRTNKLIVRNTPSNLRILEGLLRSLDVSSSQVAIEVRLVEVSDVDGIDIGTYFNVEDKDDDYEETIVGGDDDDGELIQTGGTKKDYGWSTPMEGFGSLITTNSSDGFSYAFDRVMGRSISVGISALVADNKATILSAPKLTCLNNQTANIRVATNTNYIQANEVTYNYSYGYRDTSISQTIGQIPEGIVLEITPNVSADEKTIRLTVHPQVTQMLDMDSFTSSDGNTLTQLPKLSQRSLDTTVSIRNGGMLVLGGLMSGTEHEKSKGVPGLRKIPILGHLFKSKTDTKQRNNLLIFITAQIMNADGERIIISDYKGSDIPSEKAVEEMEANNSSALQPRAPLKTEGFRSEVIR